MHRIDHSTAAAGGFFTEGDPGAGTPATRVTDDWLNDVQENINAVIEGQGLALVKGDYTQLNQAINTANTSSKFFTLQSSSAATWVSPTLTLANELEIIFRTEAGARRVNKLAAGAYSISDGSVLVFRKDVLSASPVTLALEGGAYADLSAGQYIVISETSLTLDFLTDEVILFRNRGGKLEMCISGNTYEDGEKFTFGVSSAKANPYLPPIGTIIPFYDFNGALTFDTSIWKYCDGSSATVGALGSQTLPDLSGRYLVGFGTDGGGDIDSAAWATAVTGNANHLVNLQHSHTVNSHSHDVNIASFVSGSSGSHAHTVTSHTHTTPDHSHTLSSLGWARGYLDVGDNFNFDAVTGVTSWNADRHAGGGAGSPTTGNTEGIVLDGATDSDGASTSGSASPTTDTEAAHTHTIDPANTTSTSATPGTDSQLSTTQSIQPRSIRVRYIMRVA